MNDDETRLRDRLDTARTASPAPEAQTRVPDDRLPHVDVSEAISQSNAGYRIINRRYVLERRLGGGGMGEVYLARDLIAEKHQDADPYIALKLLNPSIRNDPQAITALQRECSRAQRLAHPNVVKTFLFDEAEDDGSPFITMELIRGESLETVMQEHPHGMPLQQARPLIRQLCEALSHAHENDLIHSDVKPGNIFVSDAGSVKVLDFGISSPMRGRSAGVPTLNRAEGQSADTLFDARRDLGALSPVHAPLEMWLNYPADPRDDVYSASVVIYELLSGRHPYGGQDARAAKRDDAVVAPLAGLTRSQNAALRDGLALERANRLPSIRELQTQLLAETSIKVVSPFVIIAGVGMLAIAALALYLIFRPEPSTGVPAQRAESAQASPLPSTSPAAETRPVESQLPPLAPAEAPSQTVAPLPISAPVASPSPLLCAIFPTLRTVPQLVEKAIDLQAAQFAGSVNQGEVRAVLACLQQVHAQGNGTADSRRAQQELQASLDTQ